MNQGMEAVPGLRISGPTFFYGDNISVIHNTQSPESTLRKKSNSICYHAMPESVAMVKSLTRHIPTAEKCAVLANKIKSRGQKRDHLVCKLFFDIMD